MDSSRQALQTNGKLFFQISDSFFELVTICLNNSGGLCKRVNNTRSSLMTLIWEKVVENCGSSSK